MANFNFNKVILGGRLTNNPELKQTPSGVPVCTFSIAVNRKGKDAQTDFFNCTAWRATGEFINKFFGKGASICVTGTIQNRSWTDNNGNKRYATDIIVDEASFVDSRNDSQGAESSEEGNYMPEAYSTPVEPDFEEITDDDNLPF